jgi:anthranilate/para-aminobenzoate synthase component I
MQIIDQLESEPRRSYSGVVGYMSHGGVAEFGMTIRTVVVSDGMATIGVGGGITIDSVPAEELQETKVKARVLLQALQARDPWVNW